MERKEIVQEFFKRGHLLTEEALVALEGRTQDISGPLPFIIEARDVRTPYRIIKNITQIKKEITKDDFVKFYNSKYEKMKEIITSRLQKDFVSLNKIDSTRREMHVIGIVKDIRDREGGKTVDLEDTTTSVPVIFEDTEDLELDDVVAIRAVAGGRVLYGKKILYPDIPLRSPTTGTGKACFISDICLDEVPEKEIEGFFEWFGQQSIRYLFISGKVGDRATLDRYVERHCYMKTVFVIAQGEIPQTPDAYSSKIVSLSNPAMIEVGGIKVLMMQKGDTKVLKKRHLGKSRTILDEDVLVLDEVPDIMHTGNSNEPSVTNYKSVTLVNSGSTMGEFRPIVVDFATRDVDKVHLKGPIEA